MCIRERYKYLLLLQECTSSTFELVFVVIVTHEPLCVQMEVFIKIFIDFDGLQNNFLGVKQPNC